MRSSADSQMYLFGSMFTPYLFASAVMAVALADLWRRRRETRGRLWLLTAPFVLLELMSIPALRDLGFASLERRYEPLAQLPPEAEAIVVLGAGVLPATEVEPK